MEIDTTFFIKPNGLKEIRLTKESETEKAICFTQTKNICVYHPPGMIGSPFAKYAKKKYYYWIPKKVLKNSKMRGHSNIEDEFTFWRITLPSWFKFKESRSHFLKKKKK